MAAEEEEEPETNPSASSEPVGGPAQLLRDDLPTVYSDGVWSAFLGDGVMKVYLARFDHGLTSDMPARPNVTTQVVMPIRGFVAASVFLEAHARHIVSSGLFPQEEYDRMRNNFFGTKDEKSGQ